MHCKRRVGSGDLYVSSIGSAQDEAWELGEVGAASTHFLGNVRIYINFLDYGISCIFDQVDSAGVLDGSFCIYTAC